MTVTDYDQAYADDPNAAHQVADAALYNLPAERAVLGLMLLGSPSTTAEIAAAVKPTEFSEPAHERIFDTAVALTNAGQPVDIVTLATKLGSAVHRLPDGVVYLTNLYGDAPAPASASHYVAIVKAAATRRAINAAGVKLQQLAASDGDVAQIRDHARTTVETAVEAAAESTVTSLGGAIPGVVDIAQHGQVQGLATPWEEINHLITGLTPGRFVVVGARPGVGKSVMGTNLALHVAHRHKKPVVVCSLEMSAQEVTQRVIAAHASVDLSRLEHGTVDDRSWNKLGPAITEAMDFPIEIDDSSQQTITSIRATMRHAIRKHGPVPLCVVDYIQLISARDRRVSRNEQIGEITRDLKIIAREFNTCVVAMSQVNREGAQRHEPTLSDLRESGSIEADADVVILLHVPEAPEDRLPPLVGLVAKNRSGRTGRTELALIGHYARITGYARHDQDRYR